MPLLSPQPQHTKSKAKKISEVEKKSGHFATRHKEAVDENENGGGEVEDHDTLTGEDKVHPGEQHDEHVDHEHEDNVIVFDTRGCVHIHRVQLQGGRQQKDGICVKKPLDQDERLANTLARHITRLVLCMFLYPHKTETIIRLVSGTLTINEIK